MAKPFSPTVGVHQPHLQKLEEMGMEKYFLEKGKEGRKYNTEDFLRIMGKHEKGKCPETGKKHYMEDARFDENEGLNYGNCSECGFPIIEQAYGITIDKKGKMIRYPMPRKGRWILETVEGRQKSYSIKKKARKSLDEIIDESLKKAPKFDLKTAKKALKKSNIVDFARKHGGIVLHTEMYGGTTYYKDGTVISAGKGEGHVSDSGIVWDKDVEEWLKESKSSKYRLRVLKQNY